LVCHLATGQPLATALRLLRGTRSRAGRSDSKRKVKKGKITLGSEGLLFLQKEAPGLSSIPRGSRQPLSLASSCEIRNRLLDAAISCGPFAKTLLRVPVTSELLRNWLPPSNLRTGLCVLYNSNTRASVSYS
jgi:hypothetical protein